MGPRRKTALVACLLAVGPLLVAGCGAGTSLLPGSGHGGSGTPGPRAAVIVITRWSRALVDGNVRAAARYFRLPSLFSNGPGATVEIRTLRDAERVNAALPCGAHLVSTTRDGRYVNALFRLSDRRGPGGGLGACGSGTGGTARTDFLIRDGRIVQWVRAPDRPGDNSSPQNAPSSAGAPVV
jgi:hypothetical protein